MRILVVEDEQKIAHLLYRVLTEERHIVDVAYDGPSGLERAQAITYDLIILDLMLPGVDGLEICRRLRAAGNRAWLLMLTARRDVEDRVSGLNAGADDYLTKPFAMTELVARVNALLRRSEGTQVALNQNLQVGDLVLDLIRHEVQRGGKLIDLTAKEFALLEYLMRHAGQVLTRTQITNQVWAYDSDALSNVVDIYIHYLRDKIDKGFTKRLIKTVRSVGYKIEG